MKMDSQLLFSSAQNLTTGTIVSSNVLDLANARDIGVGRPLKVAMYVTTAFASTDSGTLTVLYRVSTDNSTYTTLVSSRAYTAGELAINTKLFPIDVPALDDNVALPRYHRLDYVMGALHFTPGAITAALVIDRHDVRAYPAGQVVAN